MTKFIVRTSRGLIAIILLAGASLAAIAAPPEGGEREGRSGPPPSAIESCANAAQGASCSFEGRRGEVEGICAAPPRDDLPLACLPNGHNERQTSGQRPE